MLKNKEILLDMIEDELEKDSSRITAVYVNNSCNESTKLTRLYNYCKSCDFNNLKVYIERDDENVAYQALMSSLTTGYIKRFVIVSINELPSEASLYKLMHYAQIEGVKLEILDIEDSGCFSQEQLDFLKYLTNYQ